MEHLEIEVKFWIPDTAKLKGRIASMGAKSRGAALETNIRYETADQAFLKNRCLLRLRKDAGATLTFKSPPRKEISQFKVQRELEVAVSDFNVMRQILESIGFHPAQTYEKIRETFTVDNAELCLDELPFGTFLEIEGDGEVIRRLADRLDLPWHRRIVLNYLQMFEIVKKNLGLAFPDVTFDNFKGVACPPEAFAALFEAGRL